MIQRYVSAVDDMVATEYGNDGAKCETYVLYDDHFDAIAEKDIEIEAFRDGIIDANERSATTEKQIKALGKAIGDAALRAGIYNGEIGLAGPELIMLCENMAEQIAALKEELSQCRTMIVKDSLIINTLTNENKQLNAMLNHIAKEIHEIAQAALKTKTEE